MDIPMARESSHAKDRQFDFSLVFMCFFFVDGHGYVKLTQYLELILSKLRRLGYIDACIKLSFDFPAVN